MTRIMLKLSGDPLQSTIHALLREGYEYAQNGQARLACTRFASAWSRAEGKAPQLADSAAWAMATQLAYLHHYDEAQVWLERVQDMPPGYDWRSHRAVLMELFAQMSSRHGEPPSAAGLNDANTAMPGLTVQCLRRFQIERGGVPLGALRKRKALSVFRYLLACPNYSAYRDELIEAIWADAPAGNALHSLHVAVTTLRRYLDLPDVSSYLVFENGCYLIHPDAPVTVDSQVFTSWVKEGEYQLRRSNPRAAEAALIEAVNIYSGDYDVDGDDTHWASAERERLLTLYMDALDYLGRLYLHENRCEDALIYYRQIADRDSYREDVHFHIVTCYLRMGRRHEALRQYELCLNILREELHLQPTEEFTALYAQIVD